MYVASNPITDPQQYQRTVTRLLARIPHEGNRATVRSYVRDRQVKGLRMGTIVSDLTGLTSFCMFVGQRELETHVKRDDILDYLMTATRERIWRNADRTGRETITTRTIPLQPSTLAHRKIVLRAFYKWLLKSDTYPPIVSNLGGRPKDQGNIVADRLISGDDLKHLLVAARDSRSRALLAVLYETGFRAQELCCLNIGSVRFDGKVGYLRMPKRSPGLKTGAREVFIIDAVRYLQIWLEDHPFKGQPDAPLFVSISRRRPNTRFTNGALYVFCIRAGKRGALSMDTNPHLFRHSAATEKARLGWNEAQLRHYFGWTKDSDMPSRYVHLAAADCEKMELARRGLLDPDSKPEPALRPVTCKACGAPNAPSAGFCEKCMMPVTPEAIAEAKRRNLDALKEDMAEMVRQSVADMMRGAADLGRGPATPPAGTT